MSMDTAYSIVGITNALSLVSEPSGHRWVTATHKSRIEEYIELAISEGANLIYDGRTSQIPEHTNGYFIGPTLFDNVTADMRSYQEEIFGPVLQIVRATDFNHAVSLASDHQYGNGVAIYTRNGHAADFLCSGHIYG